MRVPSLPDGFDLAKHVLAGRSDCHITVGFDLKQAHISRFLVQLHYQVQPENQPVQWTTIARMDHNEAKAPGHDVHREGLHIDIARQSKPTVHVQVPYEAMPRNTGTVLRGCVDYFRHNLDYFVEVYEERRTPGIPPWWSLDGGDSTPTFISPARLSSDMSREIDDEAVLTVDELTALLAEVTDSTPEQIDRGAAEFNISPPWQGEFADE